MPKLEPDVEVAGGAEEEAEAAGTQAAAGAAAGTAPAAAAGPKKSRKTLYLSVACAVVLLTVFSIIIFMSSGAGAKAADAARRGGAWTQLAAGDGSQGDALNAAAFNEVQRELGGQGEQSGDEASRRRFSEDYFPDPQGGSGEGAGGREEGGGGDGRKGAEGDGGGGGGGGLAAEARASRGVQGGEGGGERGAGAEASPAEVRGGVPASTSVRYAPLPVRVVPAAGAFEAQNVAARQAQVRNAAVRREGDGEGGEAIPPFGTRLPVRVTGSFFAPSSADGIVMLSLAADVSGDGWSLPRGVMLVGRVKNVVAKKRIEVGVFGYVNPETNKLVRVSGDALGDDGGTGLKGVLRNRESIWQRFGQGARQVAGGFATSMMYRSAVPFYLPGGLEGALGGGGGGSQASQLFVEVEAGTSGYVLIKTLPGAVESRDAAPASDGMQALGAGEAELLQQIRAAREAEGRLKDALRRAQ